MIGWVGCSAPPADPQQNQSVRLVPVAQAAPPGLRSAAPGPASLQAVTIAPRPHPLEALAPVELGQRVRTRLAELGPVSMGQPNRGQLFNAVQLQESAAIEVIHPERAFGTQETIDFIERAVASVRRQFPDTRPMLVGDISREKGGWLRPHRSHQSGRDVDLGYYYTGESRWYDRAKAENLDRARTWALVRALISETDVEYIFMGRSVQQLLRAHAESLGESSDFLDEVFQTPKNKRTIVRHRIGHETHLHVRFYNNLAERSGELVSSVLHPPRRKAAPRPKAKGKKATARARKAPARAAAKKPRSKR